MSDLQGGEAPWSLAPRARWTPIPETKHQKMPGSGVAQGREKRGTRETEGPRQEKPRRLSGTWVQAEGGKGGGERTRNNGRCRHVARGAETSGRGWQVAGVDDVRVDGVPRWDRRWVAGEIERCHGNKRLLVGGGRM